MGVGTGTFSQMEILSVKGWVGVSLLLTTVPIMYRYTVPVVNREPVDYPAFWCNGLEGSSQACLQCGAKDILKFLEGQVQKPKELHVANGVFMNPGIIDMPATKEEMKNVETVEFSCIIAPDR